MEHYAESLLPGVCVRSVRACVCVRMRVHVGVTHGMWNHLILKIGCLKQNIIKTMYMMYTVTRLLCILKIIASIATAAEDRSPLLSMQEARRLLASLGPGIACRVLLPVIFSF